MKKILVNLLKIGLVLLGIFLAYYLIWTFEGVM